MTQSTNHLAAFGTGFPSGLSSFAETKTGMSWDEKPSNAAVCSALSLAGRRRTFRISVLLRLPAIISSGVVLSWGSCACLGKGQNKLPIGGRDPDGVTDGFQPLVPVLTSLRIKAVTVDLGVLMLFLSF